VPLTLVSPLLGVLFGLPTKAIAVLSLSLLMGTPAISAIGSIGAGLTLAIRRGGLILPLVVLPLLAPAVIFGAGSVLATLNTMPGGALALLAAYSLAAVLLAPFAVAAAVRLNLGG